MYCSSAKILQCANAVAWWWSVAIEAGEGKQFLAHCYANKSTPQLFLKVVAHRVKGL